MPQTRELDPRPPLESTSLAAVLSEVGIALQEEEHAPPPPPPDAVPSLIDRRCPYCHDSLSAAGQVLCARCVTPHHAACFQEHGACSLLGCGGERSLDLEGPSSRIVCRACSELTAGNAPFCSKCGAEHLRSPGEIARGEQARLKTFLRAAAALLLLSFGLGAALGHFDGHSYRAQLRSASSAASLQRQASLEDHLRALQRAQRLYAKHDLDGDGEANYASTFEELYLALAVAEEQEFEAGQEFGQTAVSRARQDLEAARNWNPGWEVRLLQRASGRQVAIGRWLGAGEAWSCDLEGRTEPTWWPVRRPE